jgi:hypothetical protein
MENPRFESGQVKEIFLCPKSPNQFWRQPSLVFNEYRVISLRPGREVELSSLSSVEVKNEWSYTATPRNNSLMTRTWTTLLSLYRCTLQAYEFVRNCLRLGIRRGFVDIETLHHQARFWNKSPALHEITTHLLITNLKVSTLKYCSR